MYVCMCACVRMCVFMCLRVYVCVYVCSSLPVYHSSVAVVDERALVMLACLLFAVHTQDIV
jgi:hypothetical protein